MNLSGNDKNKITGKKYQPVMSITGLNDQGLYNGHFLKDLSIEGCIFLYMSMASSQKNFFLK